MTVKTPDKILAAPIIFATHDATDAEKSIALMSKGDILDGTTDGTIINTALSTYGHIKVIGVNTQVHINALITIDHNETLEFGPNITCIPVTDIRMFKLMPAGSLLNLNVDVSGLGNGGFTNECVYVSGEAITAYAWWRIGELSTCMNWNFMHGRFDVEGVWTPSGTAILVEALNGGDEVSFFRLVNYAVHGQFEFGVRLHSAVDTGTCTDLGGTCTGSPVALHYGDTDVTVTAQGTFTVYLDNCQGLVRNDTCTSVNGEVSAWVNLDQGSNIITVVGTGKIVIRLLGLTYVNGNSFINGILHDCETMVQIDADQDVGWGLCAGNTFSAISVENTTTTNSIINCPTGNGNMFTGMQIYEQWDPADANMIVLGSFGNYVEVIYLSPVSDGLISKGYFTDSGTNTIVDRYHNEIHGGTNAPVMIAASDATAAEKAMALASGGSVCDGTQDFADINTLITAGAKHIILSSGTFTDATNSILFPISYEADVAGGVWLEGQGKGTTILNYTKSSGWAITLSADGAGDARLACYHKLSNFHLKFPNTSDGAIIFKAGNRNILDSLKFGDNANGTGLKFMKNDYGSASYMNRCSNIDMHLEMKYHVDGIEDSQGYFENCEFNNANTSCVKWTGSAASTLLYMDRCQVRSHDGVNTIKAMDITNTITSLRNVYNDGGSLYFTGGRLFLDGGNSLPGLTLDNTCILEGNGALNVGNYLNGTDKSMGGKLFLSPPPDFLNKAWPCYIDLDMSHTGFWLNDISDATSHYGTVCQNEVHTAAGYVFIGGFIYYNWFPRGKYVLEVRVKATDVVADDLWVFAYDQTSGVMGQKTVTTSTSWTTIQVPFTYGSTNENHEISIRCYKLTTTHNAISADYFRIKWLGPEKDTYTIGGGQQLISVSDIASLPTASEYYRGMLACVYGGSDVEDTLYQCMKSATNTYSWVSIANGG